MITSSEWNEISYANALEWMGDAYAHANANAKLKALVWFWWIDETLSANLVYQVIMR